MRGITKIEILVVCMVRFVHAIIYSASDALTFTHGTYLGHCTNSAGIGRRGQTSSTAALADGAVVLASLGETTVFELVTVDTCR